MFVPTRDQILALVAAGVRAPSADNRHHVRFARSDEGLALHADAFFLECGQPHRRLLTLMSYGAVAENIRLALTRLGHSFEPRWFPDGNDPGLVLRIEWAALVPVPDPDPLVAGVDGRHTNRRLYRGPSMTAEETDALARAFGAGGAVALEWLDAPDRRRSALRLIRLAETERFGNRSLHAELFDSIDFDAGWSASTQERLAPATLEVEPFLRLPFAALRRWNVMRFVNRFGVSHMLGIRAGDLPARLSPHVAVITSMLPPDAAALAVGRAFQRLWLAAERQRLALQPMVASAILTMQPDEEGGISAAGKAELKAGWRGLVGPAQPYVVFRLGRAKPPTGVSGRRPVADYLI